MTMWQFPAEHTNANLNFKAITVSVEELFFHAQEWAEEEGSLGYDADTVIFGVEPEDLGEILGKASKCGYTRTCCCFVFLRTECGCTALIRQYFG